MLAVKAFFLTVFYILCTIVGLVLFTQFVFLCKIAGNYFFPDQKLYADTFAILGSLGSFFFAIVFSLVYGSMKDKK